MAKQQPTIYDKDYQALITALIESRKAKGITQAQLAKQTGMPQYDISKVENFVRRLDVLELSAWLEALGTEYNLLGEVMAAIKTG